MKKLMICVDLTEKSVDLIKNKVSSLELSSFDEITIAHGFELKVYADNFHFATYPREDNFEEIQESVTTSLNDLVKAALPKELQGAVKTTCMISMSPKASLCEYAKENGIDRMVIATRGKYGIAGLFSRV